MKKVLEIKGKTIYVFAILSILAIALMSLGPVVSAASYDIDYYTLARGLNDKGEPINQPVFETESEFGGVFLTVDDYAYSYIKFKQISGPFILRTEWYSPDGKLYASSEIKDEVGKTFTNVYTWSRIQVAGKIGEESTGMWTVVTYFNKEPMVTMRFLVLTPSQAWGFVKAYSDMSKEIETLNNALAESQDNYAKVSEELSKVSSERDALKAELTQLQDKSKQLESQLSSLDLQRMVLIAVAALTSAIAVLSFVIKRKVKSLPPPPPPSVGRSVHN
ncbi:MAG: hypothetical protein QXO01_02750 [Nitrososphaerota archaeon]